MDITALAGDDPVLLDLLTEMDEAEIIEVISGLPSAAVEHLVGSLGSAEVSEQEAPLSVVEQASALMPNFMLRPHLQYLSDRLDEAIEAVRRGETRQLIIEMPPRSGKSLLGTQVFPAWALRRHPDWDIVLASYSDSLATSWSRQIRRWVVDGKLGNRLQLRGDSTAASGWETLDDGSVRATSLGSILTGFGAKIMVIDDPHKGLADAHSEASRNRVWEWWTGTALPRLNPGGHLVIVIMTRWHEDDLVGRLRSNDYPGDPEEWEVISIPAIAGDGDLIGREPGAPLISPLVDESNEQALDRWSRVKNAVGSYAWSALYQQRPSPPQGAIFNTGWWRYWTTDPEAIDRLPDGSPDPNGRVVLLPADRLAAGTWLDSWDAAFEGEEKSDYTVGQRWMRLGADRYLIAQQRGRWTFTQALAALKAWAQNDDPAKSPYGQYVHQVLIEKAANGAALIDSMKREVSGIVPIKPTGSKEGRARAVTPEIESGNIFLPHPSMPGFVWVADFISEFREFPNGANDDQVDAASQALFRLRETGRASISIPGADPGQRAPGLPIPGGVSLGNRLSGAATMRRYT